MVQNKLAEDEVLANGWLLDGYPRRQAGWGGVGNVRGFERWQLVGCGMQHSRPGAPSPPAEPGFPGQLDPDGMDGLQA